MNGLNALGFDVKCLEEYSTYGSTPNVGYL